MAESVQAQEGQVLLWGISESHADDIVEENARFKLNVNDVQPETLF